MDNHDSMSAEPASSHGRRVVVQKYGGSSVATIDKIKAIAEKIVRARKRGYGVVAVVSAMGKTTNDLLGLARQVAPSPSPRELDMLLTAGERISMSVLSMAIQELGFDAVSLTGDQCSIHTDDSHGSAKILEIRPQRIVDELERGRVVVVAGFQGVSAHNEITTLGRGGSDTTAVALAAALNADHCDIFSDVDGVYSADPRVVDSARRLDELGYEEMQWLARHGARVLNADAVEFARRRKIAIYARSTFGGPDSTVIRQIEQPSRESGFGVAGVTGSQDVLRVHYHYDDRGPRTEEVLSALGDYEIIAGESCERQVDVLLSTTNIPCEETFARQLGHEFKTGLKIDPRLGSVAAIGLGVGEEPAAIACARGALARAGVPTLRSFTRREALTCLVPDEQVNESVRVIHRAFIDEPIMGAAA